jgi:hypothetical protein
VIRAERNSPVSELVETRRCSAKTRQLCTSTQVGPNERLRGSLSGISRLEQRLLACHRRRAMQRAADLEPMRAARTAILSSPQGRDPTPGRFANHRMDFRTRHAPLHFIQRAQLWNRFWNSQTKKAVILLSNQASRQPAARLAGSDSVRHSPAADISAGVTVEWRLTNQRLPHRLAVCELQRDRRLPVCYRRLRNLRGSHDGRVHPLRHGVLADTPGRALREPLASGSRAFSSAPHRVSALSRLPTAGF